MAVKSEAQFLILLNWNNQEFAFTEKSGGESARDSEQYPDPLLNRMDSVLGRDGVSNVTLRAPYDPTTHNALYALYKAYCSEDISLSVQPITVCPEDEPDGEPEVFLGMKPARLALPSANRGSGSIAMIELEFTVRESKIG